MPKHHELDRITGILDSWLPALCSAKRHRQLEFHCRFNLWSSSSESAVFSEGNSPQGRDYSNWQIAVKFWERFLNGEQIYPNPQVEHARGFSHELEFSELKHYVLKQFRNLFQISPW